MSDEYLKLKMEQQVIYQLLLNHNIITRQEVADMRDYVRQQEPYKSAMDYVEEGERFENIMSKRLTGESITDAERQSALDYLNKCGG